MAKGRDYGIRVDSKGGYERGTVQRFVPTDWDAAGRRLRCGATEGAGALLVAFLVEPDCFVERGFKAGGSDGGDREGAGGIDARGLEVADPAVGRWVMEMGTVTAESVELTILIVRVLPSAVSAATMSRSEGISVESHAMGWWPKCPRLSWRTSPVVSMSAAALPVLRAPMTRGRWGGWGRHRDGGRQGRRKLAGFFA